MLLAIGLGVGGIAIGIGLYCISRAINTNNNIKSHEIHLKRYGYMK